MLISYTQYKCTIHQAIYDKTQPLLVMSADPLLHAAVQPISCLDNGDLPQAVRWDRYVKIISRFAQFIGDATAETTGVDTLGMRSLEIAQANTNEYLCWVLDWREGEQSLGQQVLLT